MSTCKVFESFLSRHRQLHLLVNAWMITTLLWGTFAIVTRSDRAIMKRASRRVAGFLSTSGSSMFVSNDERRIANMFISDTLPRLMKMGLVTKYQRTESTTAMLVAGPIWKQRTLFVKESLLTAVATYNKVNGLSAWTLVLDDHDGTLYAQVLPSNRKEVYR